MSAWICKGTTFVTCKYAIGAPNDMLNDRVERDDRYENLVGDTLTGNSSQHTDRVADGHRAV